MLGVTAGLIGFFAYLTVRLTAPPMGLLYSGLEVSDSAAIVAKLDSLNVPYQLTRDGTAVMVPQNRVSDLRMDMAQDGLPEGGTIGYEIFDDQDALGTTSFVQNVNKLRALEGELSRTIRTLDKVSGARVHLVLPERQLFGEDRGNPTASVVVKTRGPLTPPQITAIQNLVAAAVQGLEPTNISIVDDSGQLLSRPATGDADAILGIGMEDRRRAAEGRIKEQIEALLSSHVGAGRVRAEVMAEIDFDRITTNHESYDPDGQVVRSTQTVEEEAESREGDSTAISVANNLPGEDGAAGGGANGPTSANSRIEETVNYEISRTVTTEVREAGRVRRLSVAVIVDGSYSAGEGGEVIYQPRSAEEMEQLTAVVSSAIGFDEERGDKLEVVNLPFARPAGVEEALEEPFINLEKSDYFRIAEVSVLGIVGILLILLVLRPFLNKLLTVEAAYAGAGGGGPGGDYRQLPAPGEAPPALMAPAGYIQDENGEDIPVDAAGHPIPKEWLQPSPSGNEGSIDLENVEGKIKESTLKQVGSVVEDHPEESATVLRTWMYNE